MSEPVNYLAPDQRRRIGNALMASQYDRPTYYDQAPVERAGLLPLGTYPNGQTGLAFPGFVTEPVESWNRMYQAAAQGEKPSAEDAFNVAGAAMVGGFAAPKPTNTLGTFGGRLAAENLAKAGELRPLRAMDMAAKLKAEGADPVRIYDRTSASLEGTPYAGVHYGADGKPRFEIDDSNFSYTPGAEKRNLFGFGKGYTEETQQGLSGSLSHPNLLAAYPDLGTRRLDIKAGQDVAENGGWARGRIVAEGPADKIPQIAAHELQHELQRREGFATGTNLAWAKGDPDYSPPNSLDRALGYDPAYSDIYKPTMGEVEARNVEARLNMTPEERRMTPPWKTQDTPYGDQIDNVTPWQRFANRMLRPFYESNLGMSLESNDWIRQAGTKRRDANTERLRDHERAIQQAEAEWGSDNPLFGHNSGASATLPTRFSQGLYANGGHQGAATGAAVNALDRPGIGHNNPPPTVSVRGRDVEINPSRLSGRYADDPDLNEALLQSGGNIDSVIRQAKSDLAIAQKDKAANARWYRPETLERAQRDLDNALAYQAGIGRYSGLAENPVDALPFGQTWYHATNAAPFEQLRPSSEGALGPGVYVGQGKAATKSIIPDSEQFSGEGPRRLLSAQYRGSLMPYNDYLRLAEDIAGRSGIDAGSTEMSHALAPVLRRYGYSGVKDQSSDYGRYGTIFDPSDVRITGQELYANGVPYGPALNLLSPYYGQPVSQPHWSNSMRDGDL